MARMIEKLDEDWVDYVPGYDGNRDDSDPVVMEIRPMSAEEYRASQRTLTHGNMKKIMERSQKLVQRTIKERVREVRNYMVYGNVIQTGEDLAMHGEPQLVDDVYEALHNISTLSEGLKKKSKLPLGSSKPKQMMPGSGDVVAAPVIPQETASARLETVTVTPTRESVGHGPQN